MCASNVSFEPLDSRLMLADQNHSPRWQRYVSSDVLAFVGAIDVSSSCTGLVVSLTICSLRTTCKRWRTAGAKRPWSRLLSTWVQAEGEEGDWVCFPRRASTPGGLRRVVAAGSYSPSASWFHSQIYSSAGTWMRPSGKKHTFHLRKLHREYVRDFTIFCSLERMCYLSFRYFNGCLEHSPHNTLMTRGCGQTSCVSPEGNQIFRKQRSHREWLAIVRLICMQKVQGHVFLLPPPPPSHCPNFEIQQPKKVATLLTSFDNIQPFKTQLGGKKSHKSNTIAKI